jgi:single-strand selective monofunctional uracil DNA glycosylase
MNAVTISRRLAREADRLSFGPPVTHVYDPLVYARGPHEEYLRRFARPGCRAVLVGMNPGPFGMAQTGVPFGEVELVRTWLGIERPVGRPPAEHPKRPVQGFDCPRSEVSGRRLWGWARERFGTPERYFRRFFVWNYCPLLFLEESGRNRTPDKLPAREKDELFRVCDRALARIVEHLDPAFVIGIGRFAAARVKLVCGEGHEVGTILHPSPASPFANRGWETQAESQLERLGVLDRASSR